MRKLLALVVGMAVGAAVGLIPRSNADADGSIACWTRTDARSYTYTARYEDYDYGGGWWNNNDVRDTATSEGPDCSGLTFKTWALSASWGSATRYYWSIGTDIHGPYDDAAFQDGCGGACYDVCGSGPGACGAGSYGATLYMDAFAGGGHIAAIYSENQGGYDWFINAAGEDYGIQYQKKLYRMDGSKDGVRRYGWGPDPCPE